MPTTAASTAAAVGALTLDLPLCPRGYHFNYDYQACFADGSPPRRLPAGQMYKYACRCEGGHSWIPDWNNCWRWGTPPPNAGFTVPTADGLGPGEQYCPPGFTWSTAEQRCVFGECPEGQLLSVSQKMCLTNDCPSLSNADITVRWQHLPGDCVGAFDDWKAMINKAMKNAVRLLDPAVRMLDFISPLSAEWQHYYWDQGYDTNDGSYGPSMRDWFGPYDSYLVEVIRWVVTRAMDKVLPGGPLLWIRCDNVGKCCSTAAAPACTTSISPGAGKIKLCRKWRDQGEIEQGLTMLHELLHWSLDGMLYNPQDFGWKTTYPRDLEYAECSNAKPGFGNKCYGPVNANFLAENPQIEIESVFDQQLGLYVNLPASVLNTDNYTFWVQTRSSNFGTCAIPVRALRP